MEVRTRAGPQARWAYAFAKTLGEAVRLPSLDLAAPMAEVYRGIDFGDGEGEAAWSRRRLLHSRFRGLLPCKLLGRL